MPPSGGYPELHAGALAAAGRFRRGLARFAATRPVHGECGGYMLLGQGLEDADGTRHAMAGLLGHAASFARPKLHLGYRAARLLTDCAIGSAGQTVRGHEFHYASLIEAENDEPLVDLCDGEGRMLGKAGGRRGQVTGTFFHAIALGEPA
jgi:cobyrinic acid a,c-diamide synthase